MVPRGSLLRAGLAGLVVALAFVMPAVAGATRAPTTNDNAKTLEISVPGPFNGCTVLDQGATPTTGALLDLLRPSAFLTSSNGNLYGEAGPIASAELTSLKPETIVYTIAPHQKWSNGLVFDGYDLWAWWQRAASLSSVQSDGYRDIKSLVVSNNRLTVTAVFATPYAEWNLLFRDVEQPGAGWGCALTNLSARASLGPYEVVSATATRVVLVMNKQWALSPNRFGRIVLIDSGVLPTSSTIYFANYSLNLSRAQQQALSAHPSVLGHIGTSSNIEEITYAPDRAITRSLRIREALSWSLSRQGMINALWGSVTFSPSPAASALFSQGQSAYPGGNGSVPTATSTTTSTLPVTTTTSANTSATPGLADCLTCAESALTIAGYQHTAQGWIDASGAPLEVTLAAGPSALDRASAALIKKRWQNVGISVRVEDVDSDTSAAMAAATNDVDAAVFSRPTITTPSYAARSWSGMAFPDSYPSGVRSAALSALFNTAVANFNPIAANKTWLTLDKGLLTTFRVRPLFTAPSMVEWSNSLSQVVGSLSVQGFLDEVPTWTVTPSSTQS